MARRVVFLVLIASGCSNAEYIHGIEVRGPREYRIGMRRALEIVRARDAASWALIQGNVGTIVSDRASGVERRTGVVHAGPAIDPRRGWAAARLTAINLVHEACHVEQARRGRPGPGREAEHECIRRENRFRRVIGVPETNVTAALATRYWEVPFAERWW